MLSFWKALYIQHVGNYDHKSLSFAHISLTVILGGFDSLIAL